MFLEILFVFNITYKVTVDKNLLINQFSCEQTAVKVKEKSEEKYFG